MSRLSDNDQIYIFGTEYAVKRNRGCHGRAFYCSPKMLAKIKEDGGIWYDHTNPGNVFNLHPDPTKGEGLDFNAGICWFRDKMIEYKNQGFKSGNQIIIPSFLCGERGKWRKEDKIYE